MKPHKHAALIHAWADGAEIEYWNESFSFWHTISSAPTWDEDAEYRIKPEKEYPKSSLTDEELVSLTGDLFAYVDYLRNVADEAVKRYIKENEE